MGGKCIRDISLEQSNLQLCEENNYFTNSCINENINKTINNQRPINKHYNTKRLTEKICSDEASLLNIKKKNNVHLEDFEMIECVIRKHFFMRSLDLNAIKQIIKQMSLCTIVAGTTLFKQGSIGNYFYIVREGSVELYINDLHIKTISPKQSFGEMALLHSAVRSGTIVATSDCEFWVLERKNFRTIVDYINKILYEENRKFIQSIPILSSIEHDQKSFLCSHFTKEIHDKNSYIIKENEMANCLYIIMDGEVECFSKGKSVRILTKGDYFGEKSILLESTRTIDVVTRTSSIIYSISVQTFKEMSGDSYKDILLLNFIKYAFSNSKIFNKINSTFLENIFPNFILKNYNKNETVLSSGYNKSSKLIIVIEGSVYDIESKDLLADRCKILFEKEVFLGEIEKTKNDIIADPDCLICECDVEFLIKNLGGQFKDIIDKSYLLESLQKIPLFKNFSLSKLEKVSTHIKTEKFENSMKIINQGEASFKFYIVKEGKVDISVNSNYIRTLNVNEYFGERALFINEPRSATATSNGPVEVYALEKEEFKSIIENNLKDYLINRLFLQDNTVELTDLEYVKELGSGNFGVVSLVLNKKNKYLYAIKSISKKQIDSEQLHKNLDLERSILLQIDHPFIVKLVKTLKDDRYIYFLMEYIRGKEVFDVIRLIGLLNNSQTRFYACSIMLALDYLHERKFIYRDIKPENILVTDTGYIKLIDFGTAKQIIDRTSTIIGTPHYMAPEVVLGEGYTISIDFWSTAICMYEFICGRVPFGESAEDPMEVYLEIINETIKFPNYCKDKEFKHLISLMLCKNPVSRLSKLSKIKEHIWFSNFNWDSLLSMSTEVPYIPKVKVEDNIKTETYLDHINTIKEWTPNKEIHSQKFDDITLKEFEKCYLDF